MLKNLKTNLELWVPITLFVVITIFVIGVFWNKLYSGNTPEATAKILFSDRKFGGMRALSKAHQWGDKLIAPLREVSDNFERIDNRNAFWVAEYFAQNPSSLSVQLAKELYHRDSLLQSLVGGIGLAGNNLLPPNAFLPEGKLYEILTLDKYLYRKDSSGIRSYADSTAVELALIAAQHAKKIESIPLAIRLIESRPLPYFIHVNAIKVLVIMQHVEAAPILVEAMQSPNFHALPDAFLALVEFSDNRAIPLAIDRISPELKGKNNGRIVDELEKLTGQNFGYDQTQWKDWWSSQKNQASLKKVVQ